MLLWQIVLLAVGMILLIKGADYFVDGSSKIAKALHIPSLIIGLTLVSMGTSAPELSVRINIRNIHEKNHTTFIFKKFTNKSWIT